MRNTYYNSALLVLFMSVLTGIFGIRLMANYDDNDNDCDGVNPFAVYSGNVKRDVVDLPRHGYSRDGALAWGRTNNTVPRFGRQYFGAGGCWRHNWQYELRQGITDFTLIYPSGTRRSFLKKSDGGWATFERNSERLEVSEDKCIVTLPEEGGVLTFIKIPAADFREAHQLQSMRDTTGRMTFFEYNQSGFLKSVRSANGGRLDFTYESLPVRGARWQPLGEIVSRPSNGEWIEIEVSGAMQGQSFKRLQLSSPYSKPLAVAQIEYYAPGSDVPLRGEAFGSGSAPYNAFDGQPDSIYESTRKTGNHCMLYLGNVRRSQIARIRILPAQGREDWLKGSVIEGMVDANQTMQTVMTGVTRSDGRYVRYEYELSENGKYLTLRHAHYGDGTKATYTYESVSERRQPLLATADDPRYEGNAKRIGYTYQKARNFGMIWQETNPDTGIAYVSLELDPADSDARTVKYSDQRVIRYRTPASTNGRPVEQIDTLGRRTTYEYASNGEGKLRARIDKAEHVYFYDYDNMGRLLEIQKNGESWQKLERDPDGRIIGFMDQDGGVTRFERDAQGVVTGSIREENDAVARNARSRNSGWSEKTSAPAVRDGDSVVYNERGLIVKIQQRNGKIRMFSYDDYGRKTSELDVNGRSMRWEYDSLSRVTKQTDFEGGVTHYDYKAILQNCGNCTVGRNPSRIVYPNGRIDEMTYDTEGRLLARAVSVGHPDQKITLYEYDDEDNLVAEVDSNGVRKIYGADKRPSSNQG